MSKDDDETLLEQVAAALEGLEMFDDATREALVRGVQQALHEATDQESTTGTGKPRLRIVENDDDDDDDPGEEASRPSVRVRLVKDSNPGVRIRRPAETVLRRDRPALENGYLRLHGDEDVWQTLRYGTTSAAYRVHCDEGELHLAADGQLVVRLETGQSTDIEGAVLRVRASGGLAQGRFTLL